jgi:hypothetical protein
MTVTDYDTDKKQQKPQQHRAFLSSTHTHLSNMLHLVKHRSRKYWGSNKSHHPKQRTNAIHVQIPRRMMIYVGTIFLLLPLVLFFYKEVSRYATIHNNKAGKGSSSLEDKKPYHLDPNPAWMEDSIMEHNKTAQTKTMLRSSHNATKTLVVLEEQQQQPQQPAQPVQLIDMVMEETKKEETPASRDTTLTDPDPEADEEVEEEEEETTVEQESESLLSKHQEEFGGSGDNSVPQKTTHSKQSGSTATSGDSSTTGTTRTTTAQQDIEPAIPDSTR